MAWGGMDRHLRRLPRDGGVVVVGVGVGGIVVVGRDGWQRPPVGREALECRSPFLPSGLRAARRPRAIAVAVATTITADEGHPRGRPLGARFQLELRRRQRRRALERARTLARLERKHAKGKVVTCTV